MSRITHYCNMLIQGYESCRCYTEVNGYPTPPCRAGLRVSSGEIYRLIYDIVLSRPEDYLSIYQSSCNHNCLKCHSWYFTQVAKGFWYSPSELLSEVLKYREKVTVYEPRNRATMWHASDLCAHCGMCILTGIRGPYCPGKLSPDKVTWSLQGYGPARNIISFTGGDLYCQPAFYIKAFKIIKRETPELWIHIETNGYGLTPKNLEALYEAGLDSIWLDMKAYSEDTYKYLCGTTNKWILELPAQILDMGLVLEIVLLYIPGLVEVNQIEKFADHLANINKDIPIMLLAFFPEYKLSYLREPTFEEMIATYRALKNKLNRVRVGNIGVFCKTTSCVDKLIMEISREAIAL